MLFRLIETVIAAKMTQIGAVRRRNLAKTGNREFLFLPKGVRMLKSDRPGFGPNPEPLKERGIGETQFR